MHKNKFKSYIYLGTDQNSGPILPNNFAGFILKGTSS